MLHRITKTSKYKLALLLVTLTAMPYTNASADTIEVDDIVIEASVVSEFNTGFGSELKFHTPIMVRFTSYSEG